MRRDDLKEIINTVYKPYATTTEVAEFFRNLLSSIQQLKEELTKKIDARLAEIRNGKDGRDGRDGVDGKDGRDGRDGVDGTNGRDGVDGTHGTNGTDGSPDMAEDIRNKLELLDGDERLSIEAIRDLREALDALEKRVVKGGGGGSGSPSVSHWPRHEAFTMDGVATSVSLTEGGVGAGGTALIVRYQGQTLDLTTHYTVNGNKITLVGITPSSGDIISITYWP